MHELQKYQWNEDVTTVVDFSSSLYTDSVSFSVKMSKDICSLALLLQGRVQI